MTFNDLAELAEHIGKLRDVVASASVEYIQDYDPFATRLLNTLVHEGLTVEEAEGRAKEIGNAIHRAAVILDEADAPLAILLGYIDDNLDRVRQVRNRRAEFTGPRMEIR